MHATLMEVSEPRSPSYGTLLSKALRSPRKMARVFVDGGVVAAVMAAESILYRTLTDRKWSDNTKSSSQSIDRDMTGHNSSKLC